MPDYEFATQPIVRAVLESDADLVRKLAASGESLDGIDEMAGPALVAAIQDENAEMVALLLELGANPNGPDSHAWDTPLSEAAFRRDADAVRLLLQAGADPNYVREDSIPLASAVSDHDVEIAKLLIRAGADVYLTNRHGVSAISELGERAKAMRSLLCEAAKQSSASARLVDAVRIEAVDQVSMLAPAASQEEILEAAWLAMREEYLEVFQCLLENGLSPNAATAEGYSLLHAAAGHHHKAIYLELLLAAGADPNLRGTVPYDFEKGGMTPLMFAAHERKLSRVKMLLKAGADANVRDPQGETALTLAKQAGGTTIIKLLEKLRDQDTDASDANAAIVNLHDAVRCGDRKLVVAILGTGTDVNETDQAGHTPLMEAISHNDVKMTEYLLGNGANPLARWPEPRHSAWTKALQQRSAVKLVEVLLRFVDDASQLCVADDDDPAVELWLGLLALPKKKVAGEVTAMLIKHGVDVNQRFSNGFTPLLMAATKADAKTVEMIPVLLEAGADANAMTEPNLPYERRLNAELDEMEANGKDVTEIRQRHQHEPLSVLDLAKQNNKRVYDALRELLGAQKTPGDRYDETDSVLATFKQAAGEPRFVELSKLLAARLRSKPRAWRRRAGVLQHTAKLKELAGESFDPDRDWLECLEPLQALAREQGTTLIYQEIPVDARKAVRVLLAPTLDWASIVRMCGTNGANYGISNRDVVNWLGAWCGDYPFQLQGCGHDFVAVRFAPTTNYQKLHDALITFCPDMAGESPGANELADFYAQDGRIFLWWD